MKTHELTLEFVNENFYEIDGKIHRKDGRKCTNWIDNRNYYNIKFNNITYFVHRILWILYNQQEIPEGYFIDHYDLNRINNLENNLRLATSSQNNHNTKIRKDNTTGIKGVSIKGNNKKFYYCQIQVNNKNQSKYFPLTPSGLELAKAWLESMRKELHGEFARNE